MRISRHNNTNSTVLVLLRLDDIIIMAFLSLSSVCFLTSNLCCFFISNIFLFQVSPNNKLVAYAEDTKGNEIYTVYVIDAETQAPIGDPLVGVTSYLEWAGDNALVYITMDEILRPDKVRQYGISLTRCLEVLTVWHMAYCNCLLVMLTS